MTTEEKRVKDWMTKAGQQCPDKPTIPSLEIRKLRARLILEEAFETIENGLALDIEIDVYGTIYSDEITFSPKLTIRLSAGDGKFRPKEPDLVALADGLADLQYVNLGTAVACGIDLEPVFEEVCRSNESKWWTTNEVDYLKQPDLSFRPLAENQFCATDAGGKVIKSPSFSRPQIAPILKTQGAE